MIPAQGLVVTMTACFEDGSEDEVFGKIVDDLLPLAVRNSSGAALAPAPAAQTKLRELLQQARSWQRVAASLDPRMLPALANKEARKPFADAEAAHDRGR